MRASKEFYPQAEVFYCKSTGEYITTDDSVDFQWGDRYIAAAEISEESEKRGGKYWRDNGDGTITEFLPPEQVFRIFLERACDDYPVRDIDRKDLRIFFESGDDARKAFEEYRDDEFYLAKNLKKVVLEEDSLRFIFSGVHTRTYTPGVSDPDEDYGELTWKRSAAGNPESKAAGDRTSRPHRAKPHRVWWRLFDLKQRIKSGSSISMEKVRFMKDFEWGQVYFARAKSWEDSRYCVFLPRYDTERVERIGDYAVVDIQSISVRSFAGRDNWAWIRFKEAKKNGYRINMRTLSIPSDFPKDGSVSCRDYAERFENPDWIRQNIPEAFWLVLADLGRDGMPVERTDPIGSSEVISLIRNKALYRVKDEKLLKELDWCGVYECSRVFSWEDRG